MPRLILLVHDPRMARELFVLGLAAPCGPLLLRALVARFSPDGSRTCGLQPAARQPRTYAALRVLYGPRIGDAPMLLWLDCFSGISGDMLLGALLDAGLDLATLRDSLAP